MALFLNPDKPVLKILYRTRSGLEVDLLLETPQGTIGIEIKSRETLTGADLQPLRDVATKLGSEWRGGLIIYQKGTESIHTV